MRTFTRIAITGARGFVGTHLQAELKSVYPDAELFLLSGGQAPGCITADVRDFKAFDTAISEIKPDLLVHLAAESSVLSHVARTWEVNAGGAIVVAESVKKHCPTATVLNVSSSEVYGGSFKSGRVTEATPTMPLNVYGRTKIAAEQIFSDILNIDNCLINVRPFNHTGPGQDERFAVPSFAAQIARIEAGNVPHVLRVGNLDSFRDFLDVRDVVRAYTTLLRFSDTLPSRNLFNVCSGRSVSIRHVLNILLAHAHVEIAVEHDSERSRPSGIAVAEGECALLEAATGWSPEISLDETLRDVLHEFRQAVRGNTHPH
ncbi:GDP-mannose 4,6-dehydratase [Rhizobium sp. SL86]|uniref:GDP-mannose 4,6-dehydratase n=1 Tax=Rhizobium sp. SL86 TaxID=2995148 RepID=UPI002274EB24|nr:GDP-mannose 4,6-dehydratase [Rhizobium sp. SL86]MCY1669372.1 GDP-mannose 4,6-dehydratase [Rhizobium sp. SL86]